MLNIETPGQKFNMNFVEQHLNVIIIFNNKR